MMQVETAALSATQWQVQGASKQQGAGVWQGDQNSRIELSIHLPGRWLALSGCLQVLDASAELALVVQTAQEQVRLPLPTSLKGSLTEVVEIPMGASKVWIEPLTEPGRFYIGALQCQLVSRWQYLWRVLRRVALFCTRTPKAVRLQAGIDWKTMLTAPAECYRRIGQLRACAPQMDYQEWQQRFEHLTVRQSKRVRQRLPALLAQHPLQIVLLPGKETTQADIERTVLSISQSIGLANADSIQLMVLSEVSATSFAGGLTCMHWSLSQLLSHLINAPSQQPALLVAAGVQLAPTALCWWLEMFDQSQADCLYSDHDYLTEQGERCQPALKPDWSAELARSSHYTGDTLLLTVDVLKRSGWLTSIESLALAHWGQQLVLQLIELDDVNIQHIPAILWHQPLVQRQSLSRDVLQAHFKRLAIAADVERNAHGYLDIHYPLPQPLPLVSVVIPTRDMRHLLESCVDSVLHRTDYQAVEVLIVDNQSSEPATLAYFSAIEKDPRVRVLHYDKPFNYSAINNFAVAQAKGELICLLNNDTEVIRPDWLSQMVGQLSQSGVGIVGARLLFADNRVQHAGDVIGIGGCATHLHFRLPDTEPGYMGRAVVSQDLSAVTAACLLTQRDLYLQLGGLNETELTVAFNDVDYCLKVREAGWRVLYTPLALLYHYESVSRGKDDNPEKQRRAAKEAAYMRQRWAKQMQGDPFYNPNLNGTAADFRLSAAPRVTMPWKP